MLNINSLIFSIVLMLCNMVQVVWAAAPVTHVVLAEKWLKHKEQYTDEQKRSFILGTLFPDIRYLKVISREETHERDLTIKDLEKTSSPFIKGMRLHAFVDETREKLVIKWKIYSKLKHVKGQEYIGTFLKLVEDEVLFPENNWISVHQYLQTIDAGEKSFNISTESLREWHHRLLTAFTTSPSNFLKTLAARKVGFANIPPEIIENWSHVLSKYARDETIKKYVHSLVNEFDKEFAKAVQQN